MKIWKRYGEQINTGIISCLLKHNNNVKLEDVKNGNSMEMSIEIQKN